MAQIIARVIFTQRRQPVKNAAIGHHRLNAQNQIPCIAIAQNIHPARIGRQKAAYARRSLACKA